MKNIPNYTLYHPKWYRERVSTYWWTRQWSHLKFILRELTSVFVAYFVVLTLMLLRALSEGPRSYEAFQDWLSRPLVILFNLVSLGFILYHTITWFNLAPRALPVRVGGKRLPDWMIAMPNYVAWVVASVVVAWFILRGR
jgi:succinate dehydrogenase subunit C